MPTTYRTLLLISICAAACGGGAAPDADADGSPDQLDCAPNDASIHPRAFDSCDGVDTDCNGVEDDGSGVVHQMVYADADFDGYANPAIFLGGGCVRDGWLAPPVELDCDDGKDYANPAAPAYCDLDHDGTVGATDCDDHDATRSPTRSELCNGIDDDCDALVDDADPTISPFIVPYWGLDTDGDGFAAAVTHACASPGPTYVQVREQLDCAPSDPAIHPLQHDDCGTQTDTNCDGAFSPVYGSDAAKFTQSGPTDPPTIVDFPSWAYVELCPGTYRVSVRVGWATFALGYPSDVQLVGLGANPGDVVLDAAGTASNFAQSDANNLDDSAASHACLQNLTLANGAAAHGGCVHAYGLLGSTLELTDVELRGCTASVGGGAIAIDGPSLHMTGGVIANASAPAGMGAGILWESPAYGSLELDAVDLSALAGNRFAYTSNGTTSVLPLSDSATISCPGDVGCPP